VQRLAVDDDHLRVVTDELIRGARDGDARLQHAELELAEALLPSRVGVGNDRPHRHAAFDRRLDRLFQRLEVEAEDEQVERLGGRLDGGDQRLDSVARLND
jgi:hypothetical protein